MKKGRGNEERMNKEGGKKKKRIRLRNDKRTGSKGNGGMLSDERGRERKGRGRGKG